MTNLTTNETQFKKVRNHLHKTKSITSWEAIEKFRITRLSHYILLLRKEGYIIESKRMQGKENWYVKYKLIKKAK